MSVYYTLYLEANINDKWICISPLARRLKPDQDDPELEYVPLFEGTSMLWPFIEEYSDSFCVPVSEISEDLRNALIPADKLSVLMGQKDKYEDFNTEYWNHCFFTIFGYDLKRIKEVSEKQFDRPGL